MSDLHLGATNCQSEKIHKFLKQIKGKVQRLILNGDVFDNLDFRRLSKDHWRVLSDLRKMSDELQLIWCEGNHDIGAEPIAHLIGATYVKDFTFTSRYTNIHVLHGDIYDAFLTKHPFLAKFADIIYKLAQKLDKSQRLSSFLKYRSKTFLRNCEKIRNGAIDFAASKTYDYVCCGHSHRAEKFDQVWSADMGLTYLNSGSWTDNDCHYITVQDGKVELKKFEDANPEPVKI